MIINHYYDIGIAVGAAEGLVVPVLHKIEDRPVARNGEIVIRPMMYVALTYDHRVVDGREAAQCLAHIKELIEDPERLWLEG